MIEQATLIKVLAGAVPVILAITTHEYAHGWLAFRLGDSTAKMAGRLTLNPLKHIDPVMTLLLPALSYWVSGILFGAAKPVPVTWRNLRRPKQDMGWVALAGPMSNLGMAIGWMLLVKLVLLLQPENGWLHQPLAGLAVYMGLVGVAANSVLMWVNLIPVPPADGGRIMVSILPNHLARRYARIEALGFFPLVLVLILLVYSGVFHRLILGFMSGLSNLFLINPDYFQYLLNSQLFS